MSGEFQWDEPWSKIKRTVGCNSQWEYMDKTKLHYLDKLLPAKGMTLDVGCGSACISAWLAQKGFRNCCLDDSGEALRVARANFEYVGESGDFILGDALRLPFKDDSLDVVFSTGLIEHFDNPLPLLREMYRVLKQGGTFYSDVVPGKFSLTKLTGILLQPAILLYKKMRKMRTWYLFEKEMSRTEIEDSVENAGFTNVKVVSDWIVPLLPLPDGSNTRFALLSRVWGLILYNSRPLWKLVAGTRIGDTLCFPYYVNAVKQ